MEIKITAASFMLGSLIPPFFGWWGDYNFSISAAVIMSILVITKNIDLI